MSNTASPGTGVNNTFPPDSATCDWHKINVFLNSRTWASYWGGQGPASDGTWSTTEYLIFYITIQPTTSNSDLPKL
jgi:hypothetical protein